jgi:hypothetical protein
VTRYFEVQPGGDSTLERHEHRHTVVVVCGAGRSSWWTGATRSRRSMRSTSRQARRTSSARQGTSPSAFRGQVTDQHIAGREGLGSSERPRGGLIQDDEPLAAGFDGGGVPSAVSVEIGDHDLAEGDVRDFVRDGRTQRARPRRPWGRIVPGRIGAAGEGSRETREQGRPRRGARGERRTWEPPSARPVPSGNRRYRARARQAEPPLAFACRGLRVRLRCLSYARAKELLDVGLRIL